MMHSTRVLVTALLCSPATSLSDDEAANSPRVFASRFGNCYAKSVPAETSGAKGSTTVFRVDAGADKPVQRYSWYASQLYLECNVASAGTPVAVSVARIGPWPRGRRANATDLAIAFYRGGRLLKQYSTLDIAGAAENVRGSMSHYRVLDSMGGYRWRTGNEYTFDVRTVDARTLYFDAATGERIADGNPDAPAH